MNLTYIIGLLVAIGVMIFGMITKTAGGSIEISFGQISNFFDISSVLIVIGCTIGIVVASFPGKMLGSIPIYGRAC